MDAKAFHIFRYLDEEKRWVGLTIFDEFLPIAFLIFSSFLFKCLLIGFVLSALWFFTVRRCKAKFSNFRVAGYWFFSRDVGKLFLSKFPDATQRFWRA